MKILVVCTGNTCRSAMAEGLLKKRLKDNGVEISSAGVCAFEGTEASSFAIEVMKEHGVDLSEHKATELNEQTIEQSDLIVVMQKQHMQAIIQKSPQARGKTFFLRQFAQNPQQNIPDPYGQDKAEYEKVFEIIKESTEGLEKWMKEKKFL